MNPQDESLRSVLTEHLAAGVREDTDLLPKVHARLAKRCQSRHGLREGQLVTRRDELGVRGWFSSLVLLALYGPLRAFAIGAFYLIAAILVFGAGVGCLVSSWRVLAGSLMLLGLGLHAGAAEERWLTSSVSPFGAGLEFIAFLAGLALLKIVGVWAITSWRLNRPRRERQERPRPETAR